MEAIDDNWLLFLVFVLFHLNSVRIDIIIIIIFMSVSLWRMKDDY